MSPTQAVCLLLCGMFVLGCVLVAFAKNFGKGKK